MKTMTSGKFCGDIDPVLMQKIENAYLAAKPRVIEYSRKQSGMNPDKEGGACLYWALFAADELSKLGVDTFLQGGTMYWSIVPEELRDKVHPEQMFNFGYEFNYTSPLSINRVLMNSLPEMHVWLAMSHPKPILLDFSTGNLRATIEASHIGGSYRQQWLSESPPAYLAMEATEDGSGYGLPCQYSVEPVATIMALSYGRAAMCVPKTCPPLGTLDSQTEYYIRNSREVYLHRCQLALTKEKMGHAGKKAPAAKRDAVPQRA
jgi:hypothetical protein